MKFSIIIPSYNQPVYIGETLLNLRELKKRAAETGHSIEVLLYDSCSGEDVQEIINHNRDLFDFIEIEKDKGQYDAINKGMAKASGKYWSWLNTDDMINVPGFLKMADILSKSTGPIDYIYGSVEHINERSEQIRIRKAVPLDYNKLINSDPGIYQPGSFFRKECTDRLGPLKPYRCCFDYEYILRLLKIKSSLYCCEFVVSRFRLHAGSKTGTVIPVFVKEQLAISKEYGGKSISMLTIIGYLRLIKRKLFG